MMRSTFCYAAFHPYACSTQTIAIRFLVVLAVSTFVGGKEECVVLRSVLSLSVFYRLNTITVSFVTALSQLTHFGRVPLYTMKQRMSIVFWSNFSNFSNEYGGPFSFFERGLDLIAELWIPASFRAQPALLQVIKQQTLVFRIEQIQVNHRLRFIGIDNCQHKTIDTQNGLIGQPVCLWRAEFAAKREGANKADDNKRSRDQCNGQSSETQTNGDSSAYK